MDEDADLFDIYDQARLSMWEYRMRQRTDLVFHGGMSDRDVLKLSTVERDYFMERLLEFKEYKDSMTLGGFIAAQSR